MIKSSTAVLAASDIRKAVDFYCNVLGFKEHWLWGDPPTFGCIGMGAAEIFLCLQPQIASGVEGHMHCFFADDIESLHRQHVEAGAPIISPIENKPWGIREYTVRDPSGYHVRFCGTATYDRPANARQTFPPHVRIEAALPTAEQYVDLLTSVNWVIDHEMATEVLSRTTLCALAWDGNQLVGIARATGDGRNFTIWDVVVRPSHQAQRIGSAVMDAMLAEIRRAFPRAQFIGLFTGKPSFYERLGFKKSGGMHRGP